MLVISEENTRPWSQKHVVQNFKEKVFKISISLNVKVYNLYKTALMLRVMQLRGPSNHHFAVFSAGLFLASTSYMIWQLMFKNLTLNHQLHPSLSAELMEAVEELKM